MTTPDQSLCPELVPDNVSRLRVQLLELAERWRREAGGDHARPLIYRLAKADCAKDLERTLWNPKNCREGQ